jgi:hypothetical protein
MSKKLSIREKAISAINKQGILLVFPIKNKDTYNSIWKELYPRSTMRWEWDENGDDRVGKLWHLREELSRSKEVVYSKWLTGRATFFSLDMFKALYRLTREWEPSGWMKESSEILECLRMDSPLSTKQLKEATGLQGRFLERTYEKALKPLWQHLDIVAVGEIEDSSFPSLAICATSLVFEDLVRESEQMTLEEANEIYRKYIPEDSPIDKFWKKIQRSASLT